MIKKFPDKKYQIIVVDPPWQVKKITRQKRKNQIKMDYNLMSLDEIKELPISSIASEKCWLFLWTTQRFLFKAKDVLENWGFTYMFVMAWEKTYGRSSGMPMFGFRWNAEFIVVGYNKTQPNIYPKQKLIPMIFQAPNIKHSRKPDKFYEMIEHLGEPRIDIFARQYREGWDSWGDELNNRKIIIHKIFKNV